VLLDELEPIPPMPPVVDDELLDELGPIPPIPPVVDDELLDELGPIPPMPPVVDDELLDELAPPTPVITLAELTRGTSPGDPSHGASGSSSMLHATGATATTAMIAPPRRRTHSCWLIALTFLGPDR
jgi:hypothetical protein